MELKSIALAVILISWSGFATPAVAQDASGDPAAIRALVRQYVEARDTGDPHAIKALFTPDADQLVSSGEWRKGPKAVVDGTVASSVKEKGQRRTIEVESVRFLSPD
ncbi:MAG: SgcJ/EcaC family oxidoreductase, partial [Bryobacteraceae bacterium]